MMKSNSIQRSNLARTGVAAAVALMLGAGVGQAMAKELPAGFVINKENYESIKNDTFENKTIASMVPEKLEWMIKNYNLTIKLANSKKIEMDPKYVEWSKKNIGTVKFNPADRTV
jgi:hypothetical protein